MKHDPTLAGLVEEAADLGSSLTEDQVRSLLVFEALLLDRAIPLGLVAARDASRIRVRHVLDSLRAAAIVGPEDLDAYDLGSGAGLPGIVVAIARPTLHVRLVDARRRRAAFLELAVAELRLTNASVVCSRIEDLRDLADLCFARALAPSDEAWRLASPLLEPNGRLVYFAGASGVPPEPAGGRIVDVRESPLLESAGPLVIMAR